MTTSRIVVWTCLVIAASGSVIFAAPTTPAPALINYQGVLRDAGGEPVATGTYDMIFRFFDADTGGNEILVDRHTALDSTPVTVSGGLFNVALGGGDVEDGSGPGDFASLTEVFRAHEMVYLEVRIDVETLSPRTRILAAAYSLGGPRGVVYTRWGKATCPAGASLVYSGYMAAGFSGHTGGTASQECLASAPTWDVFDDANHDGSLLFNTEYTTAAYGVSSLIPLDGEDAPCAVCLQPDADTMFMYPGSQVCPADWNTEYIGYLMSAHFQAVAPKVAACVDRDPDAVVGAGATAGGNLLYPTEAECGGGTALRCPPYVDNREVTCSVCTR